MSPYADNWVPRAACRGRTSLMFPGPETTPGNIAKAKAVCEGCPVRPQCAEAGRGEPYGIWGGETATERYERDPAAFDHVPITLRRNALRRALRRG